MKIIVIGAGLAGVQTAYFLNRDGHDVTLVERRTEVAMETSHANGGLITPSHAAPWNSPGIFSVLLRSIGRKHSPFYVDPLKLGSYIGWGLRFIRNSTPARFERTIELNAKLARYSLEQFHTICEDVSPNFDHRCKGTMMVYRSEKAFETAKGHVEAMTKHEIKSQLLNAEQLVQQEPALRPNISELVGGIYYEEDEHGNAASYVTDLTRKLEQDGVTIKLGYEITGFVREGDTITHVKTNEESLDCDAVVMAAGNFSRSLVKSLGLSLPIQPVKGNSITYDASSWQYAPSIPVIDDAYHIAVTPLGKTVRIVGTAEFCGADTTVRPERMELLRRSAVKLYPEISEVMESQAPIKEWAGLRPMTPDCLPILGQAGADNLYLNTGHSYLGWTTAAGTARMISDAIANRQSGLEISPYRLSRFQ